MIPKIIHYCWFGGNPESEDVLRCLASWRKFLPDYEIRRWDESNYAIEGCGCQYVRDAYREKKWAFVSDYARLDIVCRYGGIYLDTDVEVIRSFDDLLGESMFCGFESRDPVGYSEGQHIEYSVNFGLGFGAEEGHVVLRELMDLYKGLSFYHEDGSLNLIACPRYQTEVLTRHGLVANNETQRFDSGIAFSPEYFCPQSNLTQEMLCLSDRTYSIHHFSCSWIPQDELRSWRMKDRFVRYVGYAWACRIGKILAWILPNLDFKQRR